MTPEQLGESFANRAVAPLAVRVEHGTLTVDVDPADWAAAAGHARDAAGCDYFDWLSAVDELDDGIAVVLHVYSLRGRHHLLLRTRLGRDTPSLSSLTGVYRGANWHERETAEMFGVTFDGHPNPLPLLLPDGFEGHPLRKDFVLASRVAKQWPGEVDPGQSTHELRAGAGPARRRRNLPPGVPDPATWGPAAARAADAGRATQGEPT